MFNGATPSLSVGFLNLETLALAAATKRKVPQPCVIDIAIEGSEKKARAIARKLRLCSVLCRRKAGS